MTLGDQLMLAARTRTGGVTAGFGGTAGSRRIIYYYVVRKRSTSPRSDSRVAAIAAGSVSFERYFYVARLRGPVRRTKAQVKERRSPSKVAK